MSVGRNGHVFGRTVKLVWKDKGFGQGYYYFATDAYYTVKEDVWTRVNTSLAFLGAPVVDDQGRVVVVSAEPPSPTSSNGSNGSRGLVMVQGGEVRKLDAMLDTPVAGFDSASIIDGNDKGQLLITVFPQAGPDTYVLTPR